MAKRSNSGALVADAFSGLCLFVLMVWAASAPAADVLTDFRPSPRKSLYGAVSVVSFSTNEVVLKAGALAYHPPGSVRELRLSEPVWVIGYRTEILDAQGKPPADNYQCHTFLSDEWVQARQDQHVTGIFSDAYTQEVLLPEGFGLRFAPGKPLRWMTMFNNRQDTEANVSMRVWITLIRDKDLEKPLRPLRSTTRSVKVPPLFWVPPGRHSFETTVDLDFSGTIHLIGAHVHPHAESMELFNVTRDEPVWKGLTSRNAEGEQVSMGVYSSTKGYAVRTGETYRIVSTYNNPTSEYADAMAGMFIFYATRE